MNNNIKEVEASALAFAQSRTYPKGFYAGDGEYWVKCDSHEAAENTRMKYIIFVNTNGETVIYKA